VPVGTTQIEARRLGPGRYYARVSAMDDEFEGPFSPTIQVLVAVARLVRNEEKNSVTAQISPGDIHCGLDGGPMAPLSQVMRKTKKMPSRLQCGPSANTKLAASLDLPPPSVGPFDLKPRLERPDPQRREALLVLRLQDANQQPLSGAALDLGLNDGVMSGPLEEGDQDGEYQASIWWNEGVARVEAKARVDNAFELVAEPLTLPIVEPPAAPELAPEPPPPPPPVAPARGACGCESAGAPASLGAGWVALVCAGGLLRRRARRDLQGRCAS
jgi:hypothetical protein